MAERRIRGVGDENESAWVQAALRGDEAAFAELVNAYQGPVYNLAYRMLGSASDAEDAAQEAFLRVYKRLGTYDSTRKFSSWILSVAAHYCIDRLRRRRGTVLSMEGIQAWRWIADKRPQPEESTVDSERDAAVREMLADLPEQYRLAIILRYWHDLSYEEIAEITQSTESAIKSRLHRARRMMAERITSAEKENETMVFDRQGREADNALSTSF